MSIRSTKARAPYVGDTGAGAFIAGIGDATAEFMDVFIGSDGYAQFNADHTFSFDNRYLQAFWASTDLFQGGDWTFGVGVGFTGAAMVAAYSPVLRRVRGEFDVFGKFTAVNASPIGIRVSGAGEVATITIDNTPNIAVDFTAEATVDTVPTTTSQFLRVRRNQVGDLYFYYRVTSSVRWTEIAHYTCDFEDDVEISIITATGNKFSQLIADYSVWHEDRIFSLTDGGSIALDASRADRFSVTLGGNRTLANPTSPYGDGQEILVRVIQDGTGSRTLAYGTNYRFFGGALPVLSTTAGDVDYLKFVYNKDDGKWDYVDITDIAGAYTDGFPVPVFHETFLNTNYRPFWEDSEAVTSGDFTVNTGALVGAAETNASDWIKRGIEGEVDFAVQVSLGTASSIGPWLKGNSLEANFKRRSAAVDLRIEMTGEADIDLTGLGADDMWLRIRWTTDGVITFFYKILESDPWLIGGSFTGKDFGFDKALYLDSADGGAYTEVLIYDNMGPHQLRSTAPKTSALTDAATIAVDASKADFFHVTLGDNRTLGAPTNPLSDGQKIMFRITQDGTGSRTLAFNAIYRFSTALPSPTISTATGAIDYLGFIYHESDNKWDYIAEVKGF